MPQGPYPRVRYPPNHSPRSSNAPPLSRSNDQDTSHCVSLASVMKELNSLKETVRTLKGEVTSLHREKQTLRAPSTCHISIACKTPRTASELPSLLGCPILNTVQVGRYWKAKIHRHCLYDALQSTSDTHSVHICMGKQPPKTASSLAISFEFSFLNPRKAIDCYMELQRLLQ